MSRPTHFQSEVELIEAAHAAADLMASWGVAPTEWLLGKDLSLYFTGVFAEPSEIERDITIFILLKALPWPVNQFNRSLTPPVGTHFAHDLEALETRLHVGVDIKPIPDATSGEEFITDLTLCNVGGRQLNVENPRKIAERRYQLTSGQLNRSIEEARDYYFLTTERYQQRLTDYHRLRDWAADHDGTLVPTIDETIRLFTVNARRCFPELFTQTNPDETREVTGLVAGPAGPIVEGSVVVVRNDQQPLTDRILVFPYFRPMNNHLVKTARAIIVDGGGRLSHAAILCRELGVPCIVNTKIGSKVFKDGDKVEVDATTGIVRKL